MPIFGLNNGMVPIIAYNYGAQKTFKNYKDDETQHNIRCINHDFWFADFFSVLPPTAAWNVQRLVDMIAIGVPALRIISISFIAAGFCIVTLSILQALGQGIYSLVTSISRQLIILLPVAFILSKFGNLDLVWWSIPIAEIASVILCIVFVRRTFSQSLIFLYQKNKIYFLRQTIIVCLLFYKFSYIK